MTGERASPGNLCSQSTFQRTGLVLAGGQSRRFGRQDKALAELGATPLLVRVVESVATAVDEVLVSCRPAQVDSFERVLGSSPVDELVVDQTPGAGPLAGIAAGLDTAAGTYAAVVACDMPFVDARFLTGLFDRARADGVDAVVPVQTDGQVQPLQAVYWTETMRVVAAEMVSQERGVWQALDEMDVSTVAADAVSRWSLYNVNTPKDFLEALRRYND